MCPIIHRLNPKAHVNVKKWIVERDQSGVEIISTSCTRSDVRSWFSFYITYNRKTNHQGGSSLFGTPVSCHKVHISLLHTRECFANRYAKPTHSSIVKTSTLTNSLESI